MRLERLYRFSLYLMLVLATLILSVDANQYNRFALMYPLLVGVACALAFVSVDLDPRRGLSRDLANLLGLASFVIAMMEYWSSPEILALALGHWLVYLQLIKVFLPKTVEDDWFLFLLGLVQVVIGVYLSQSERVGGLLLAWAVTSLWTMGLFHLQRETRRAIAPALVTITPAADRRHPYPGLFNAGFLLTNVLVAATTLALGGLIFLAMPRWNSRSARGPNPAGTKHLTGFSPEVQLGRMGEILENDAAVLSVETLDAEGRRIRPPEDMRWRGVTLGDYEAGRWRRLSGDYVGLRPGRLAPPAGTVVTTQKIRLEASENEVLFAPRPIYEAASRRGDEIGLDVQDGTIYRAGLRIDHDYEEPTTTASGPYEYTVQFGPEGFPQPAERFPDLRLRAELTSLPRALSEQLAPIASQVLAQEVEAAPQVRARRLESWFRDSGVFAYTLTMARVDDEVDPVLDFLVNRKEGHCEYFASALTLLLRSQQIPARVVNGFKGGDWNELLGMTTVRQKHAHSWVEALVGRDAGGRPAWLVLDPTPGLQREQVVAQVGGLQRRFRGLSDALRYIWIFYVVGFDQERQQYLIYGPARRFAASVSEGFGMLREQVRAWLSGLLHFDSAREFFSVRGFVVSCGTMLLLVGLFRAGQWLFGRLYRRFGGAVSRDNAQGVGVVFYHRLLRLLAETGLERPASETPREFARRAATFLGNRPSVATGEGLAAVERAPDGERLETIPGEVVEAFYRVRFGEQDLDAAAIERLEARLDALEAGLRPTRG